VPDLTPLDLEELKRLAEASEADNTNPDYFAAVRSLEAFNQAASPQVVLSLINQIEGMRAALEPFAACARELEGWPEEGIPRAPDGEWAKFRLLTDDYRRAAAALSTEDRRGG